MGTNASMAASNSEATRDTQTRFKVNHARQVVDQVTLLRERVKRQEKAIETVIAERDRVIECCEKQKVLIARLQQKNNDLLLLQTENDHGSSEIDVVFASGSASEPSARGGQFGRRVPGKTTKRVNSMRTALLRIGGIEILDGEEQQDSKDEDSFDAAEFQPIADNANLLVKAKDAIDRGVARVSPFKRDMSVIESDGLQTSR